MRVIVSTLLGLGAFWSVAAAAQDAPRVSPPARIEAVDEDLDAPVAPPPEEEPAPAPAPEPSPPTDPWADVGGSATMDTPTPDDKERLVILPVVAESESDRDIAVEATARLAEAYATQERFDVRWGKAFYASTSDEVRPEFGACAKARCARVVAEGTDARFVVYARLFPGAQGAVIDLKVFSARRGQPVIKTNAESPVQNARTLLPVIPQLVQGAIPAVEEEKPTGPEQGDGEKKEEKEPTIFDNPILVTGVAVVFVGAFMVAGGSAHVLAAERAVSTPGVHRFLKEDALNTWYWGAAAAAGGVVVMALGTAGIGAGLVMESLE